MRVAVLAAILCALALAGCGTSSSKSDARATVGRFSAALAAKRGPAACAELTPETRSSLESQEKKPCPQAILSLDLKPARPLGAKVDLTSAIVRTSGGEAVFLDQSDAGWRISSAGCKPMPGEPYDCELEG